MEAVTLSPAKDQKIARKSMKALSQLPSLTKLNKITLETEDGEERITLPKSAYQFLVTIINYMAEGKAISIVPSESEVTTQKAADILHVSRPHVIKLLEEGEIPYHKAGTHRRIKIKDLEAYRTKFKKRQEKALQELAAQAQELNLGY